MVKKPSRGHKLRYALVKNAVQKSYPNILNGRDLLRIHRYRDHIRHYHGNGRRIHRYYDHIRHCYGHGRRIHRYYDHIRHGYGHVCHCHGRIRHNLGCIHYVRDCNHRYYREKKKLFNLMHKLTTGVALHP